MLVIHSSFIFLGKFTLDFTYDLFFFSSTETVLIIVAYYNEGCMLIL